MNLYNNIINFLSATISMYLTYIFFDSFAPPKTTSRIIKSSIIIFSSFALFFVFTLIEHFLIRLIFTILIVFMVSLLFQLKLYNNILLTFIMYAIQGISEYAVAATITLVFSMDMSSCLKGKYLVLGLSLSKLVIFAIIAFIRAKKHNLISSSFQKSFLVLFIIPISTFGVFLLQYNFLRHLTYVSYSLSLMAAICYSILLIANIVVFNILDNVYNTVDKDYRLAMSEKLISIQEEQYQQILNHNKSVLKIKHDHKNFLIGIMADLDAGLYSDIRATITKELDYLTSSVIPPNRNSVIYSLIQYKTEYAAQKGILITCEYHELQSIQISSVDLSIILGNALDNAIEATEKISLDTGKIIKVLIKVHNEEIIITINNPISENVDINNLKSTKSSAYHGFGILSMKNLAEAHGGDVVFSMDNNSFNTYILLANKNE